MKKTLPRKCAELYATGYSKIDDYKSIKISFIQTGPFNSENFAVSEYNFDVKDLMNNPTPENYGYQWTIQASAYQYRRMVFDHFDYKYTIDRLYHANCMGLWQAGESQQSQLGESKTDLVRRRISL